MHCFCAMTVCHENNEMGILKQQQKFSNKKTITNEKAVEISSHRGNRNQKGHL